MTGAVLRLLQPSSSAVGFLKITKVFSGFIWQRANPDHIQEKILDQDVMSEKCQPVSLQTSILSKPSWPHWFEWDWKELFIPRHSLPFTSTPATLQRLFVHVCVLVVYHVAVLQSSTSAPLILSAYPSLCLFLFTYLSISHQVIVSTVSAFKHPPSLPADTTALHKHIKNSYPKPLYIYIYILIH